LVPWYHSASKVAVSVVTSGGAERLEHFYEAAVKARAQILLTASVSHYRTAGIREVKEYVRSRELAVRS
jgi:cyclase